jgi:hypothetical protein
VVGWPVRGSDSGGAAGSRNAREAGVGAKNPKRAAVARFWAGFGLQADVWGPVGSLDPLPLQSKGWGVGDELLWWVGVM